jgi:outer membrane biosynthesis protein TonB
MRAGWLVSLIGHIGAVLMTMLAWEARSTLTPEAGSVVPVEIVDIAAESNVRALAEETPEEEAADAEQEPVEAEPEPAPAPTPTPPPRPRTRTAEDEQADLLAGLTNRERQPTPRRTEGQRAERTQQGAGLGTAEVAALEDRARALARAHLRRCWRMPIDLPEPDRLVVTVEFDINRNGTLNGQPRVLSPRNYTFDPAMRTAVESAVRAVRVCDPYPFPDDPVVGEHYDIWRRTEFTFRPSF